MFNALYLKKDKELDMSFVFEVQGGASESGAGAHEVEFLSVKSAIKENEWGNDVVFMFRSTAGEDLSLDVSFQSGLIPYYVWILAGKVAPESAYASQKAMLAYVIEATQDVVGKGKTFWIITKSNGFAKAMIVEPQCSYSVRFDSFPTRDENGYPVTYVRTGGKYGPQTKVVARFIVQGGPNEGYPIDIHLTKKMEAVMQGGQQRLKLKPGSEWAKFLDMCGLNAENGPNVVIKDYDKPLLCIEKALRGFAKDFVVGVRTGEAGYVNWYQTASKEKSGRFPVVACPVDTTPIASSGNSGGQPEAPPHAVGGDSKVVLEGNVLAALNKLTGDKPATGEGLSLTDEGKAVLGKVLKPFVAKLGVTPGKWPPRAWTEGALRDTAKWFGVINSNPNADLEALYADHMEGGGW